MKQDINQIMEEYGQFEWQYLKAKEDLRSLWSLDVMAYAIYWPGAQGAPGTASLFTNRGLAYKVDYCFGETTYEDLRSLLPDLPDSFEELRPWEESKTIPYLPTSTEAFSKMQPWDFDGYQKTNGWYWYGIHSGCWARIHESIWPSFYTLAENHKEQWLGHYWMAFVRKAIADRSEQLGTYLEGLDNYELIHECSEEGAQEVASLGIVAWKESDQGWGGLLCKNGKAYFKLGLDFDTLGLPISQRLEIRNDTLPGWRCFYCGLGHRLMVREEYYPSFRELTYGMGKNANLYTYGFNILANIIKGAK